MRVIWLTCAQHRQYKLLDPQYRHYKLLDTQYMQYKLLLLLLPTPVASFGSCCTPETV